ncbi:phage baseplate assembly protein [Frateuria sp. YIM B11624]|uniref:phage baseplate assembly protein n=1 Tax=Frateuria sp. YIM B11624 TaxID=3143185 RepID=UPI003C7271A1
MSDLVLTVDGQRYAGWQSLRLSRGVEQVAGGFELTVTERFDGLSKPRPIRKGQKCSVSIDGQRIIQGWIDVVAPDYDAETHTLGVSGRDATGDLVDCAAICKAGTYHNRTLAQIAQDLAAPFKVPVIVRTNVGAPFAEWRIEPGETVMENLERAARYRGVLLMSDGQGNLVITQPAELKAPAALELGKNILKANGHSSQQQRFAEYIVKAQQAGTDLMFGDEAAAPSGTALDTAIARYRPTIILAEDQANAGTCKTRALWQRTVAAARSDQVVYTVVGWLANGQLWQPNALVDVRDRFLDIDETRLISQVDFTLDEQGERTELTVVGRHAYDPIKLPEPEPDGGLW